MVLRAAPGGALGLLVAVVFAAGACSDAAAEPPDGSPAYPNRRAVFPTEGRLLGYVTNGLSDTISVVDLDAMVALGSAPIGRDPVDVDGPTGLAIDRGRGLVYVALSYPAGPHASHGTAPRAGYLRALALSDLRPLGELRVDPAPGDLTLSDDGGALAVAHYDLARAGETTADLEARRATVALIEPADALASGAAGTRRTTVCVAPYALAFGRTAARLFVACTGEDTLAVVDAEAGTVLARVPAGDDHGVGKPYALVADRGRGELLLSNRASHQLILLAMDDAPSRRFTVEVPGVPYFATWLGDDRLVVPTQGPSGAVLVDARTGAALASIVYDDADCFAPRQALAAGGRLFLLCEGDRTSPGAVVAIDPTTLAIGARVAVGVGPDRMAVLTP